jgi:hypothetical protein
MAVVYPLANGNWSTVANWYSGGLAYGQLPLAGDDVYADGKVVAIDVDITVNLLTTLQRSGGANPNSGNFTCSTARTITANTIQGWMMGLSLNSTGVTINVIATNILSYSYNQAGYSSISISGTSGTVNITANSIYNNIATYSNCIVIGGSATVNITSTISTASNYFGVITNGTSTLNFTGNVGCGQSASVASITQNGAGGTTNVTGALIGASSANGWCIQNTIGTVNILSNQTMTGTTGIAVYNNSGTTNWGTVGSPINIYGATSGAASGFYACYLAGVGNVTLYGNIILQSYAWSTGQGLFRHGNASAILTINGNVTGGTVPNTMGVNLEQTGTVIVNGNVTGGSHATNTPALSMSQAGTFTVNGIVTSNAFPAIHSTVVTAKFNLLGNIVNTAGLVAYYGSLNVKISPSNAQQITYIDTNNVNRILATSNITAGAPLPANVRNGLVYGSLSQYLGTLIMATPDNVRNGVNTDATVGTADLTAEDIFNEIGSSSNTIAVRLRNVSTVETTGDQLASYTV